MTTIQHPAEQISSVKPGSSYKEEPGILLLDSNVGTKPEMPEYTGHDNFTPADRRALTELALHMTYVRESVEKISTTVPDKAVFEEMRTEIRKLRDRVATLENFRWWLVGGGLAINGVTAAVAGKFIHL